jgi:hypothetical protein
MGQHLSLADRCLVLGFSLLLDSLSSTGVVMDCGCKVTAKYRSNGLVTDIEFTDAEWIMCPLHKAAPALLHALEEARDYMLSRGTYRGVKVWVDKALAQAKGESSERNRQD